MTRTLVLLLAFGLAWGVTAFAAPPVLALAGEHLLLEARDGRIVAHSPADLRRLWSVEGVPTPSRIVVAQGESRAIVLDPISNQIVLVDLKGGAAMVHEVPQTPIAAAFLGDAVFVVSRDGRAITRIAADGSRVAAAVPRDAAMLHASERGIFVYGRASGDAVLLDPLDLVEIAAASLPPFASDLEVDGGLGYLVLPRSSKLISFSLETLAIVQERSAGAVPTDLVRAKKGTLATAATLAIADPSSKRIWRDEGSQSLPAAVGRGFLRGLLGLGLFTPRSSELPTGVDRVFMASGVLWAFDTSTGSLYRTSGSTLTRVAEGLEWGSFAVGRDSLFVATESGPRRLSVN